MRDCQSLIHPILAINLVVKAFLLARKTTLFPTISLEQPLQLLAFFFDLLHLLLVRRDTGAKSLILPSKMLTRRLVLGIFLASCMRWSVSQAIRVQEGCLKSLLDLTGWYLSWLGVLLPTSILFGFIYAY